MSANHLTVRNLPADVSAALAREKRRRGKSLNQTELQAFLEVPVVEVLPVDRSVAEIFAVIFADLRRRSRPVPINDIWIAATCARAGATLLTWDVHFREMPMAGSLILE
ncbi:MAG TPA: PIN domain-containing protein [Bryobacteraceae bacterium]|nr:PIN domain-containing protein [Bryobacteraceae bacterium]